MARDGQDSSPRRRCYREHDAPAFIKSIFPLNPARRRDFERCLSSPLSEQLSNSKFLGLILRRHLDHHWPAAPSNGNGPHGQLRASLCGDHRHSLNGSWAAIFGELDLEHLGETFPQHILAIGINAQPALSHNS